MKALIVNLSSLSSSSSSGFSIPHSSERSNVETFFSFETENPEIMINNLTNRFLIHSLVFFQMTPFQIGMEINQIDTEINQNITFIQISLKNGHFLDLIHITMRDTDSFIYMIIDRYIFEKFYELMIDSKASRTFTTEYEQYLAYHKDNKDDVMNISKAETIHVQFEIESI
jgi:hypothetical protein